MTDIPPSSNQLPEVAMVVPESGQLDVRERIKCMVIGMHGLAQVSMEGVAEFQGLSKEISDNLSPDESKRLCDIVSSYCRLLQFTTTAMTRFYYAVKRAKTELQLHTSFPYKSIEEIQSTANTLQGDILLFARDIDGKIKSEKAKERTRRIVTIVGMVLVGVALIATGAGAGLGVAGLGAAAKTAVAIGATCAVAGVGFIGAAVVLEKLAAKEDVLKQIYRNLTELRDSTIDMGNAASTILGLNEIGEEDRAELLKNIEHMLKICKEGFEIVKRFM